MKRSEMIKIAMWLIASSAFLFTGYLGGDYVKGYFAMLAALCLVEGLKVNISMLDKEPEND